MQRFILQENIKLLSSRLAAAASEGDRRRIQAILIAVEHELALLESSRVGVLGAEAAARQVANEQAKADLIADFGAKHGDSPIAVALIDPAPGLIFVEANEAYCAATGREHDEIVGATLFARFPENPDDPSAESVHALYTWLRRIAETRQAGAVEAMRYDIQDADGVFSQHYWRLLTSPLLDTSGDLILLMQEIEDVTADVLRLRRSA